jgi:PAS domain S-box-containing protein
MSPKKEQRHGGQEDASLAPLWHSSSSLSPLDLSGEVSLSWILRNLPEGLVVEDEHNVVTYVNDKFCDTLGVTRKRVLGRSLKELIQSYAPLSQANNITSSDTDTNGAYELVWITDDKREVHALASPKPLTNAAGVPCGCVTVFTNLTPFKHMGTGLDSDHDFIHTLMEHLPELIFVKDAQGRYVMLNKAMLRMLGAKSAHEVIGKTDGDFFPRDMARRIQHEDTEVIENNEPDFSHVTYMVDQEGQRCNLLSTRIPLHSQEGRAIGLVTVCQDITDQLLAVEALSISEERIRQILEYSRDVAYKVNLRTNRYEYVSPSIQVACGFAPDTVIAMGLEKIESHVHPDDLERYRSHGRTLLRWLRKGKTPPLCEYRMRHAKGHYRWFSENASLLLDKDQRITARIGTLRDITDSKLAEDAVRAASRMEATATLAGGVAHDFNNLMAVVLANAELLQIQIPETADSHSMLEAISNAAEQAGQLAQQMLAFAHGGKHCPKVMDLNSVIQETLHLEKHSLSQKISVLTNLSGDLRNVYADPVQIHQIIMNLTINASEAISENGSITLSTENFCADAEFVKQNPGMKPGDFVLLKVSDTGAGMSSETSIRIFEPFFSTKFHGRGLGLAVTYGIVKNHGGLIQVSSREGGGTCFRVYFPASKERLTRDVPAEVSLPVGNETILIVDDEKMILTSSRRILESLGYTVLEAYNGQEALDLVQIERTQPIAAILLDMAMPVMGGAEAFPLLKKEVPEAKVLICSGYELDTSARELLEQGACAFLQKPFRLKTLAKTLRDVLDNEEAN